MPGASGAGHELALVPPGGSVAPLLTARAREGVEAGELVYLNVDPTLAALVVAEVGPSPLLLRGAAPDRLDHPASVLADCMTLVEEANRDGHGVRLLNQAPVMRSSAWWDWSRVEAAANLVVPAAWQLCIYDQAQLAPDQEAQLRATHRLVPGEDVAPAANPDFREPDDYLDDRLHAPVRDADGPATVTLHQPARAEAKAAVEQVARRSRLGQASVDALLFAANEAVANAYEHGRPPYLLEAWVGPGLAHVAVTDAGPGPQDPLVGLLRADDPAGCGLWLSHQMVDVRHEVREGGYTVHLVAAA